MSITMCVNRFNTGNRNMQDNPSDAETRNILEYPWGLFYLHGLTLIIVWTSNHMPSKVCDEISNPILNFNGCTVRFRYG